MGRSGAERQLERLSPFLIVNSGSLAVLPLLSAAYQRVLSSKDSFEVHEIPLELPIDVVFSPSQALYILAEERVESYEVIFCHLKEVLDSISHIYTEVSILVLGPALSDIVKKNFLFSKIEAIGRQCQILVKFFDCKSSNDVSDKVSYLQSLSCTQRKPTESDKFTVPPTKSQEWKALEVLMNVACSYP